MRRAEPEDLGQMAQMWDLDAAGLLRAQTLITENTFPGQRTVHYVLEKNGDVGVVFALTEIWRPQPPRRFLYHNFAVARRFRGQALLPLVFRWLESLQAVSDSTEVMAIVDKTNDLARKAFLSNDFRETHVGLTKTTGGHTIEHP
ncbi:hypothetical protein [Streptomyces sp. NPDC006285]|uniref:hypothetical protein n=1 Tax=Streptomyces sp. NPDC006285 TaxID=3364742 RepID=UPI0036741CC4